MPTILRLEALDLPRKTFELNDAAMRDLETIRAHSPMSDTAAIHQALRHFAESLERGQPIYISTPPEGPRPPSAPSAASLKVIKGKGRRKKRQS